MWLAASGGLCFAGTALASYVYNRTAMAVTSGALALTSSWYHMTGDTRAFWLDQAAMFTFVGTAGYESYIRGVVPSGLFVTTGLYCTLVYHVGKQWKCWAFHPEEQHYYHATLHILPLINFLCIFTFFPFDS